MSDIYVYLRLCWGEATNHLSMPITIVDRAITIGIFLKVFGFSNYIVIAGVGVCGVLGMLAIGHLALRSGLTAKQQSLMNKYNPELQQLLKK